MSYWVFVLKLIEKIQTLFLNLFLLIYCPYQGEGDLIELSDDGDNEENNAKQEEKEDTKSRQSNEQRKELRSKVFFWQHVNIFP